MCRWRRRRTRCGCSRGTVTRSTSCSTNWSFGSCATGCSTRWPPSNPRSMRDSTSAGERWSPARSGNGWPITSPTAVGPASRWWARTCRTAAMRPRWRSLPPTATAPSSTPRPRSPRTIRRWRRGWTLNGVSSDTALAAYLVRPGQRSFTLDDLSLRYLRRELRAETSEQQQLSLLDDSEGVDDQAVQTAVLRARAVVDLADALDAELARIDSTSLLAQMELPVQGGL